MPTITFPSTSSVSHRTLLGMVFRVACISIAIHKNNGTPIATTGKRESNKSIAKDYHTGLISTIDEFRLKGETSAVSQGPAS